MQSISAFLSLVHLDNYVGTADAQMLLGALNLAQAGSLAA